MEDATSGICVPAGAFNFVCISDGTASLTLELEHFYKDLPDDKSALESLLQLNDGWSRRHSSVHDVNERVENKNKIFKNQKLFQIPY